MTNLRNPTAVHNDSTDETDKLLGMYMGKTLTAVSEALSKPDGAFRDDVLATVWILANYEVWSMMILIMRVFLFLTSIGSGWIAGSS